MRLYIPGYWPGLLLGVLFLIASIGCDAPERTRERAATEQQAPAVPTRPAEADPADWCAGHALPESMCTKCNPELVAKFKEAGDWCAAHGFPESVCPQCHPMTPPQEARSGRHAHEEHHAEGTHGTHDDQHEDEKHHGDKEHASAAESGAADWCGGHGLPESKCTRCNPELIAKFKEAGDWCAEHGYPESACPHCNPVDPPEGVRAAPFEEGTVVRLKKKTHEQLVDIHVVAARAIPVEFGVEAPANLTFDQNRVAAVRSPVSGIVREVLVDLGEQVDVGDPMFVLASAEVGDLQAQVRSAREELKATEANLARQRRLQRDGIAAARKVEVAEQEAEAARARLNSVRSALQIAGSSGGAGRFTVRAPIAGAVVERMPVVGTFADTSTPLATVADATAMWAIIDVPERDATAVHPGQSVKISVDGAAGLTSAGEVTWVSPVVDPRTRTVKVRADIENHDGRLRANQFATATIGTAAAQRGVVVPHDAIQRVEDAAVLFVRREEGVYIPRAVELGPAMGDLIQVRQGVQVGDSVVTTGAFLLKTELKRDSIGAGCCEVE